MLVEKGFDVVGGTRHPEKARTRAPNKEFCHIDLGNPRSVTEALDGMDAVVYLVHSMSDKRHYDRIEKKNAETLQQAAQKCGLERIVYLGGMRPSGKVSKHLESRLETGRVLRSGSVPTLELQATMVIGGGSESFRIVRDLAARLPWMLLPTWLKSRSEPIAIDDIAAAIAHALSMPLPTSRVLEAPGPEVLTGREILVRIAHALGQEPRMINVPLVSPSLSSHWIRLVTRANPTVAKELVEGLKSDIVSNGETIWDVMPEYHRTPFDTAVQAALHEEEQSLPGTTRFFESLIHRVAE